MRTGYKGGAYMRMPEYLSPSSIKIFEKDREDFAIKYLLENRSPRPPQTQPMSVGSAFDAYVKSYLYYNLNGNYGEGDLYRLENIFEEQVEEHNRDWALSAGKHCFTEYQNRGALADLMTELQKAIGPPRFEFSVQDTIELDQWFAPLLGKPDCYFTNSEGIRVVYDWKVNGFCSTRNTSPMKGYIVCRDAKGARYQHKDAVIAPYKGVNINVMLFLEHGNKEWADQLSIYSWLLGEPVGSENVVFGIDQITGPKCSRISSHRLRIEPVWQFRLMERIGQIWAIIQSGHIFQEVSREESDERIATLELLHASNDTTIDEILK
jgi:hypothetical protein